MRTAKFVARKQWVVTGADDMFIRVYNHNTMEKIKTFEAHTDYIRCYNGVGEVHHPAGKDVVATTECHYPFQDHDALTHAELEKP